MRRGAQADLVFELLRHEDRTEVLRGHDAFVVDHGADALPDILHDRSEDGAGRHFFPQRVLEEGTRARLLHESQTR